MYRGGTKFFWGEEVIRSANDLFVKNCVLCCNVWRLVGIEEVLTNSNPGILAYIAMNLNHRVCSRIYGIKSFQQTLFHYVLKS